MPELQENTSGAGDSGSGANENKEAKSQYEGLSVEELTKKLEANDRHNKALFGEKKKEVSEKQALKTELDVFRAEKAKQVEDGMIQGKEFDKVLQIKDQLIAEYKAKDEVHEAGRKEAKINDEVLSELKKLGYNDSKDNNSLLFKVLDKELVAVDPSSNHVIGAPDAAKDLYERFGKLGFFKTGGPGTNQEAPDGSVSHQSEKEAYMADLRKANTQKELDDVRRKHGRNHWGE